MSKKIYTSIISVILTVCMIVPTFAAEDYIEEIPSEEVIFDDSDDIIFEDNNAEVEVVDEDTTTLIDDAPPEDEVSLVDNDLSEDGSVFTDNSLSTDIPEDIIDDVIYDDWNILLNNPNSNIEFANHLNAANNYSSSSKYKFISKSKLKPVKLKGYHKSTSADNKEYDRFILEIDKGIIIPDNLPERINKIMDTIEDVTNWSYMDGRVTRYKNKKFLIKIVNETGVSHASIEDVYLYSPKELTNEETIIHELLHVIAFRNAVLHSPIFVEGFAETFSKDILDKLGYNAFEDSYPDIYFYKLSYYNNFKKLTSDNVKETFFVNPARYYDVHRTSFFITEYFRETYGTDSFF